MKTIYQIFSVAWKDLQLMSKDRGTLFMYFLLPLFLGSLFASMNLVGQGEEAAVLVKVCLVNQDPGGFGSQIVQVIETIDELSVERFEIVTEAEQRVAQGDAAAAIIIPPDFSANIDSYIPTKIEVIVDPAEPQSASIVTGIMNQVVTEVTIWGEVQYGVRSLLSASGALAQASPEQMRAIEAQSLGAIMTRLNEMRSDPGVTLISEDIEGVEVEAWQTKFFAYIFPGLTVMFIFFMVSAVATWLLQEKESGAMRRLKASPISGAAFIAGKMLAYMLVPILQVSVMFAVGNRIFGMPLGRDPLALVALTIIAGLTATGLGMLVSTFANSSSQAGSAGVLMGFVLAGIGGSIPTQGEPLARSGGFVGILAQLTPHAHAVEGYYRVLAEEATFVQVLPQMGILLAMGVTFYLIAIWRFKFE